MTFRMIDHAPPMAPVSNRVEELEQRVAELTLAVEARNTFIASAGHELRNPMMPIIGQLDLLLTAVRVGRASPEQVEQRLARIKEAVRHYVKRATILLDVSRITSGKLQLEPVQFDLVPVLHAVVGEFTEMALRVGVPLVLTAPDRLVVTWDRLAVEQIVDNLISNAIKYGNRTPIGIMAKTENGRVLIEVCDGGAGIPAADRKRVFGLFERAVGTGERRSGFGVGLWVVCHLVTATGGTVTVGDAPAGGALFTLDLPQHVEGACL